MEHDASSVESRRADGMVIGDVVGPKCVFRARCVLMTMAKEKFSN